MENKLTERTVHWGQFTYSVHKIAYVLEHIIHMIMLQLLIQIRSHLIQVLKGKV